MSHTPNKEAFATEEHDSERSEDTPLPSRGQKCAAQRTPSVSPPEDRQEQEPQGILQGTRISAAPPRKLSQRQAAEVHHEADQSQERQEGAQRLHADSQALSTLEARFGEAAVAPAAEAPNLQLHPSGKGEGFGRTSAAALPDSPSASSVDWLEDTDSNFAKHAAEWTAEAEADEEEGFAGNLSTADEFDYDKWEEENIVSPLKLFPKVRERTETKLFQHYQSVKDTLPSPSILSGDEALLAAHWFRLGGERPPACDKVEALYPITTSWQRTWCRHIAEAHAAGDPPRCVEVFTPHHLEEVHKQSPILKTDLEIVGHVLLGTPVPPKPANFTSEDNLSWAASCALLLLV